MMWERCCEHEAETRELARLTARGEVIDPAAREHAAGCAICQELLAVTTWMQELASVPVTSAPLPDPTYLWWKAELLRRWDAQQRAVAPIEVGERVEVSVGLLAAAAMLIWAWRYLFPAATTSLTSLTLAMAGSGLLLAVTAAAMVRSLMKGS